MDATEDEALVRWHAFYTFTQTNRRPEHAAVTADILTQNHHLFIVGERTRQRQVRVPLKGPRDQV